MMPLCGQVAYLTARTTAITLVMISAVDSFLDVVVLPQCRLSLSVWPHESGIKVDAVLHDSIVISLLELVPASLNALTAMKSTREK